MRKKGLLNISIANYLYENRDGFIKNISVDNDLCSDDINHVIIGRWYYGLFLIAKSILDGDVYNQSSKYLHECYRKDEEIVKESIWYKLADYYIDNIAIIQNTERLAQLRKKFEYNKIDCTCRDLELARALFEDTYYVIVN